MSFFPRLLAWLGQNIAWLSRLLDRLTAYAVQSPIDALLKCDEARLAEYGAARYASLAAEAKRKGWGISRRKRRGNIVIIIDLPQKNGPAKRIRLKFKEKA